MINIKWSYGDTPEKSNKNNNPINLALSNDIIDNNLVNNNFINNNLINNNINNFKNKNTYRENLNNKLNDRFMIKQINKNLNFLYICSGYLAAFFLILVLLFILTGISSRIFGKFFCKIDFVSTV